MDLALVAASALVACPSQPGLDTLASQKPAAAAHRPDMMVCVYGQREESGGSWSTRVVVYEGKRAVAELKLPARHEDKGGPLDAGAVHIDDFNFDGRLDVAVSWMNAGSNASFHVWIATERKAVFRFDPVLSDQGRLEVE